MRIRVPALLLFLLLHSSGAQAASFSSFLRGITLSLTVSDFEYSSINEDLKLEGGLSLSNKDQELFAYQLSSAVFYDSNFDQDENRTDSEQKNTFISRFVWKNVIHGFHYTNLIVLKNQERDRHYTTKYDLDVGPVGLKKDLFKSALVSELSLEYMPLYNFREFFYPGPDSSSTEVIERLLKHRLSLVLSLRFLNELLSISNKVFVQAITPIDQNPGHTLGNDFDNQASLTIRARENLDIGYTFGVNIDQIRRIQGLDRTERTHKFNVTLRLN